MNIKTYNYKSNVGIQYWQQYLGRYLTKQEHFILNQTKSEKIFNNRIKDLHIIADKKGLYIPLLTNMHGNCIFESLQYYELCENVDDLRIGMAFLMTMFKNKKKILPNQEESLSELFSFSNDIEFVFCKINKQLYKYNFDAMCIDLATDSSWTRLNTQLVFMVMSLFLNLKFIILNDSHDEYVTEISTIENENTKTIYLGQLGELHYIPLDIKSEDKEYDCPKYTDSLNDFHIWARSMALSLDRVIYDNTTNECVSIENNTCTEYATYEVVRDIDVNMFKEIDEEIDEEIDNTTMVSF